MHLTVIGKLGKSCQTITKTDQTMGSLPINSWCRPAAVINPSMSVRYSHCLTPTWGSGVWGWRARVRQLWFIAWDPSLWFLGPWGIRGWKNIELPLIHFIPPANCVATGKPERLILQAGTMCLSPPDQLSEQSTVEAVQTLFHVRNAVFHCLLWVLVYYLTGLDCHQI